MNSNILIIVCLLGFVVNDIRQSSFKRSFKGHLPEGLPIAPEL